MNSSVTILEKDQYSILYRVSYLALFASLYGCYRQHYELAIVPGSIFLTSINYWRRPDYSWRLYLDLGVVRGMVMYQHIMAFSHENAVPYYAMATSMIVFYLIAQHYYNKKDYWKFVYAHTMVHVCGNIGNVVLYSGQ